MNTVKKHIKDIWLLVDKHFYDNADMAILVATGSQRLLLISKMEESQLGAAYEKAIKEGLKDGRYVKITEKLETYK